MAASAASSPTSSASRACPYVVIDRRAERVQEVLEHGGLAVEADASREDVLTRVGIHRARGLIAAVGTDAENVYTVLSARVLRPDLFIIARVESEDAEAKLRRAGADRVISPYQLGGIQMAATALRPAVVDFMRLATTSERLDLSAEQVEISPQRAVRRSHPAGGQFPASVRRDRRGDQAGRRAHAVQPRARRRDADRGSVGRPRESGTVARPRGDGFIADAFDVGAIRMTRPPARRGRARRHDSRGIGAAGCGLCSHARPSAGTECRAGRQPSRV